MLKKDYKLVVFDLDGTLVDTRKDIALTFQELLRHAGLGEVDDDTIRAAIGGGARNAVIKLTGFEGDQLDQYEQMFYTIYNDLCAENTTVYDGGKELVQRLKNQGKILAVVTMKVRIPTLKILERHGLLSMFDDVISFEDVDEKKPDPSSFCWLLSKYGIKAEDALMVGDTTTDMRYAKNAGVDVVAAKYGYGITADILDFDPEYEIDSLKEL